MRPTFSFVVCLFSDVFPFVGRHFMPFPLPLGMIENLINKVTICVSFHLARKALGRSNAGCCGQNCDRRIFGRYGLLFQSFLTMKLPKLSGICRDGRQRILMLSMKIPRSAAPAPFRRPCFAISLTMSALVIITSIFSLTYFQNSR